MSAVATIAPRRLSNPSEIAAATDAEVEDWDRRERAAMARGNRELLAAVRRLSNPRPNRGPKTRPVIPPSDPALFFGKGERMRTALLRASLAFDVPVGALLSDSRAGEVVHARYAAMLALSAGGMAYAAIARRLGRDHTSVIHGCRRALELASGDGRYAARLAEVCA